MTTASAILLTAANRRTLLKGLPFTVRRGFHLISALRYGRLDVVLPDGRALRIEGERPGPEAKLVIHDYNIVRRVFRAGDIGVAESYMAGEWSSPDVTTFLLLFCVNHDAFWSELMGRPFFKALLKVRHWLNRNSRTGARRNIAAHYDLGNAFYDAWLDPSMTYSSAYFGDGASTLNDAQRAKYRRLATDMQLGPDHKVLEVGCGWGGFAEFAASEIGAHVTALTISREQFEFTKKRLHDKGLADRVDVKFQDYRDETGVFDRIASIEMFEAVGQAYWPSYFERLASCLKPGGRAGLQIITIQDRFFEEYRGRPDFIQRYIFPGGMLPSPGALGTLADRFGFDQIGERIFGHDYARTLAIWRERFLIAWPAIEPLGFDTRFRRMWEFYLHYCEAGFLAGHIDVRQIVYARS